jgi:hypothetical protein
MWWPRPAWQAPSMAASATDRARIRLTRADGSAARPGAQALSRGRAPSRTLARVAGVLFLTATAAGLIGTALLLRPLVGSADYLAKISA